VLEVAGAVTLLGEGAGVLTLHAGRQAHVSLMDPFAIDWDSLDVGDMAAFSVRSPMHGKLIALLIAPGESVDKGQRLAIVEAMKMEHVLTAPKAGLITEVLASVGAQVAERQRLITIGES